MSPHSLPQLVQPNVASSVLDIVSVLALKHCRCPLNPLSHQRQAQTHHMPSALSSPPSSLAVPRIRPPALVSPWPTQRRDASFLCHGGRRAVDGVTGAGRLLSFVPLTMPNLLLLSLHNGRSLSRRSGRTDDTMELQQVGRDRYHGSSSPLGSDMMRFFGHAKKAALRVRSCCCRRPCTEATPWTCGVESCRGNKHDGGTFVFHCTVAGHMEELISHAQEFWYHLMDRGKFSFGDPRRCTLLFKLISLSKTHLHPDPWRSHIVSSASNFCAASI